MAVKNGAYSLEERREAVAYFNNNGVPKQIQQLLNKMFKENPSDIFGYMVRYMVNFMFFSSITSTLVPVHTLRRRNLKIYLHSNGEAYHSH